MPSVQSTETLNYSFGSVETLEALSFLIQNGLESTETLEYTLGAQETVETLSFIWGGRESVETLSYLIGCPVDISPPDIFDEIPIRGSVNNPPTTSIGVTVKDLGDCPSDVNLKTVKIYVNGELAYDGTISSVEEGTSSTWVNGFQSNWNGPEKKVTLETSNPKTYRFSIDPISSFSPGSTVTVRVVANDKAS